MPCSTMLGCSTTCSSTTTTTAAGSCFSPACSSSCPTSSPASTPDRPRAFHSFPSYRHRCPCCCSLPHCCSCFAAMLLEPWLRFLQHCFLHNALALRHVHVRPDCAERCCNDALCPHTRCLTRPVWPPLFPPVSLQLSFGLRSLLSPRLRHVLLFGRVASESVWGVWATRVCARAFARFRISTLLPARVPARIAWPALFEPASAVPPARRVGPVESWVWGCCSVLSVDVSRACVSGGACVRVCQLLYTSRRTDVPSAGRHVSPRPILRLAAPDKGATSSTTLTAGEGLGTGCLSAGPIPPQQPARVNRRLPLPHPLPPRSLTGVGRAQPLQSGSVRL